MSLRKRPSFPAPKQPSLLQRLTGVKPAFSANSKTFDSEHKSKTPFALVSDSSNNSARPKANPLVLAFFVLFGLYTRLTRIGAANSVVWDEAHFGKFAGFYNTRRWYTDLHPPFGKSLLGLFGHLGGFDGKFNFDSGATYPADVPFVFMRTCCATFASFTVPLAYLTGLEIGLSHEGAVFLGVLVGTALKTKCLEKSVKWVGLFVVAVVGLHTVNDLVSLLFESDFKLTMANTVLPIFVYLAAFQVHFAVLNKSGPGDSKMGSLSQEIAFGSEVQIRYHGAGGGLIHSHESNFPEGSKEQQITLYGFRADQNNRLIFLNSKPGKTDVKAKKILRSGDIIRLEHKNSGKLMRSHNFESPTSKIYREVSFGGSESVEDPLDLWRLLIVDDIKWKGPLRTLTTRFRLQHVASGCYLRADFLTKLPPWGYEQHEVACTLAKPTIFTSRNALWNVEEHWNDELPPGTRADYPRSFFTFFMEDNADKILGNSMLVPEPGKPKSSIESEPWEWPTLHASLQIGGAGVMYKVLGTPMVWGGVTVALVVYCFVAVVYVFRWIQGSKSDWAEGKRGNGSLGKRGLDDFWFMAKLGLIGWIVNFIPYILMPRVT
ncbi:Protein O-mannosyltransferase 2 [Physocladia obscura]|uniref:Dolichyl-phosphate-mannose--protein mannosyltransferase n=1 Tax=Physocladia obscura TaxID=109957 RepID=A0AAD5T7E3_9FUNG|nr:Protein O-mannosyltransferase 2 [Physocladia obscura]